MEVLTKSVSTQQIVDSNNQTWTTMQISAKPHEHRIRQLLRVVQHAHRRKRQIRSILLETLKIFGTYQERRGNVLCSFHKAQNGSSVYNVFSMQQLGVEGETIAMTRNYGKEIL